MTVTLYNYTGDNRTLSKVLSGGTAFVDCVARDSFDFRNPIFNLQGAISPSYNYMTVADGGKTWYYFARINNTRDDLSTIIGTPDVLKQYDAQIRALPGIAARTENENNQNAYLPDGVTRKYAYTKNISAMGTNGSFTFAGDNMILVTVG